MYQLDVITLFPEMFSSVLQYGVIGRAISDDLIGFRSWNPRDFTEDKHNTVDDRPYGGGPGMVLKYQPFKQAISAAKSDLGKDCKVICLSPQGRQINQERIKNLPEKVIFVAGRYEGIDERFYQTQVDEEWSLGDYVLSGGELGIMLIIDAVARFIPGTLGDSRSANEDSFSDGLLDCPHYTRPQQIDGMQVPEVLLSGDHEKIKRWRYGQRLGRTYQRRKDLWQKVSLDKEKQQLLNEYLEQTRR